MNHLNCYSKTDLCQLYQEPSTHSTGHRNCSWIKTWTKTLEKTIMDPQILESPNPFSVSKSIDLNVLNETNLTPFLNIFHTANLEKAVKWIDDFDIHSDFSHELWSFSDNFPTVKIPYRNLEGEYFKDTYHITNEEWVNFNDHLQTSLLTLLDLSETPEVKKHDLLSESCSKLINKLLEISYTAEAFAGMNELSAEMFSSLKMENPLLTQLGSELRKIERDRLLEFLGHLAVLTLNRNENTSKRKGIVEVFFRILGYPSIQCSLSESAKSRKITQGLEKLRDYINLRSPRQERVMSPGKMGVAEFIYGFCFKTLFPELSDKEKYTKKMTEFNDSDDRLIEIAAARNIGGYHFVCDVLTDKGVATFDSMGTQKILGNSLTFQNENLVVSQSFYQSCKPLEFDHINVPIQKNNNCYLAAGWLKFCALLHFFEQSVSQRGAL